MAMEPSIMLYLLRPLATALDQLGREVDAGSLRYVRPSKTRSVGSACSLQLQMVETRPLVIR
jgi:hypothetical protein